MSKKTKVRNIRNEYRHSFIWNFLVIVAIMTAAVIIPTVGSISQNTMIALCVIEGGLMMSFMFMLEKYSITISGYYECSVIALLSSGFTFVLMSFINLIFIHSIEKLYLDLILFVVKILGIMLIDLIILAIRNNKKLFKKPRLLIIASEAKNLPRMKRIKYGVLNKYDSWYENTDGMTDETFFEFIEKNFPKYDAVCVLDGLKDSHYHRIVSAAMKVNKDLFIVPELIDVGKTNARIARFDDVLTLYMPESKFSPIEKFLKRVMDIVLSVVGLIVAAIPMLFIALAIKITSPGPIFYKQRRLTIHRKEFEIYKFRTMIPDAEKLSGPKFAEKNDPRITKIGKILRSCRLDELPQIFNILKGDMSVVGPRPERPVFVEQFEKEIENYDYRFEVKAGLTALSHVYGRYSTYIHDRTYYDLFYIMHYSLLLDIKIILLTAKTMFLKSAAEGVDNFKEKTVAKAESEVIYN